MCAQEWNDERDFKRGEVYFVDFGRETVRSGQTPRLIQGSHRVVVLFDSVFPRKTVAVVPISSLEDQAGNSKDTISSDVILYKDEYINAEQPYANTVVRNSFIMTNQIRSVSRNKLERDVGKIIPKDMLKLDIQLISTLSLTNTVQQMIEEAVDERLAELGIEVVEVSEDSKKLK